jgi:hypothetical protein
MHRSSCCSVLLPFESERAAIEQFSALRILRNGAVGMLLIGVFVPRRRRRSPSARPPSSDADRQRLPKTISLDGKSAHATQCVELGRSRPADALTSTRIEAVMHNLPPGASSGWTAAPR